MNHELLKKHIQSRLNETVSEFQERGDIVSSFLNPIIAYVDAEDPVFDGLFARGLTDHPKRIYRPGKCIVVHYTPFTEEFVKENGMCDKPTEKWIRGYMESLWLAMELNRILKKMLLSQGRLTSHLNNMMEWDSRKCQEDWSHKFAAAIGDIGRIGPSGCLIVNGTFGGRASGIITDGLYAEPCQDKPELKERLEALLMPRLYDGPCSAEMIAACPGCAISADGINKRKCQEFCRTLNEHIPAPEVCARCFRFGL